MAENKFRILIKNPPFWAFKIQKESIFRLFACFQIFEPRFSAFKTQEAAAPVVKYYLTTDFAIGFLCFNCRFCRLSRKNDHLIIQNHKFLDFRKQVNYFHFGNNHFELVQNLHQLTMEV